jgi:hypothetical protein
VADRLVAGLHCTEVAELAAGFVLGALEPAETAAVRAHLAACPEAHAEVAELGSVAPVLFESVDPVEPSPSLKGRILRAAAADAAAVREAAAADQARSRASDATPTSAPTPPPTQAPARGGWQGLFRRPVWAGLAMAAVIVAVALGTWNIALRSELDAYRAGVAAVLDRAGRPGSQLAVLGSGAESGGPSGLAAVGGDGSIALVMRDLDPTAGTEVYEAWLIVGADPPIPIGSFTVGSTRTATFTTSHAPVATATVALTREPGPGATTPTLPIIASGAAHTSS